MNNKYIIGILLASCALISACKKDAESGDVNVSSIGDSSSGKAHSGGCSVANVDGGAQITCGATSAFVANGTSGSAKIPRLIYRPSIAAGDIVVGDHVISMTKGESGSELITVWVSSVDAIAQYENGIIYPQVDAMYFETDDCSGDAHYLMPSNSMKYMGDRLVFSSQYYRVEREIVNTFPKSKQTKDGNCEAVVGNPNYSALKATAVNPGITTVLTNYRIKVQ